MSNGLVVLVQLCIYVCFSFTAIFSAVVASRPRADVAYCINALAKRLSKTHNWAVCYYTSTWLFCNLFSLQLRNTLIFLFSVNKVKWIFNHVWVLCSACSLHLFSVFEMYVEASLWSWIASLWSYPLLEHSPSRKYWRPFLQMVFWFYYINHSWYGDTILTAKHHYFIFKLFFDWPVTGTNFG